MLGLFNNLRYDHLTTIGGLPAAPAGMAYKLDENGNYMLDENGAYILVPLD
jgi:hypothetical protein